MTGFPRWDVVAVAGCADFIEQDVDMDLSGVAALASGDEEQSNPEPNVIIHPSGTQVEVVDLVAALRASVEAAKQRREAAQQAKRDEVQP